MNNTAYKEEYKIVSFADINAMENGRFKKLKVKPTDYQNLITKGNVVPFEIDTPVIEEQPVQEVNEVEAEVKMEVEAPVTPKEENNASKFSDLWHGVNARTVAQPEVKKEVEAAPVQVKVQEPVKKETVDMEAPSIKGLESIEKREERFRRMFKKAQEELSEEDRNNSYVYKVLNVGVERLEKMNAIVAELKDMSNASKEKINVYNVRNVSTNQVKDEIMNSVSAISVKSVNEAKFPDVNEIILDVNQKLMQIAELKKSVEHANELLSSLMVSNDEYKEKENKIAQDCDNKINECMKEKQNFFDVMDRSLIDAEKIDKLHAQDKKLREERAEKITALTDLIPMLQEEEEPQKVESIDSYDEEEAFEIPNNGHVINIFDEYRTYQNESANRAM